MLQEPSTALLWCSSPGLGGCCAPGAPPQDKAVQTATMLITTAIVRTVCFGRGPLTPSGWKGPLWARSRLPPGPFLHHLHAQPAGTR